MRSTFPQGAHIWRASRRFIRLCVVAEIKPAPLHAFARRKKEKKWSDSAELQGVELNLKVENGSEVTSPTTVAETFCPLLKVALLNSGLIGSCCCLLPRLTISVFFLSLPVPPCRFSVAFRCFTCSPRGFRRSGDCVR